MWMTDYIRAVKRELRDEHHLPVLPGGTEDDPLVDAPDGEYPMTIEGKLDRVRIQGGKIFCCNFDGAAVA